MFHYHSTATWASAAGLPALGRLIAPLCEAQNQLPFIINLVYDHGSGPLSFPEIPLKGFQGLELGRVKISGQWKGDEANFDEMKRIIDACDVPTLPPWIEFSLSISYEEKTGIQKPNYSDFVTIRFREKAFTSWLSISHNTSLGASFEEAMVEIMRFATLSKLPVDFRWIDGDVVEAVGLEEGVDLSATRLKRADRFGLELNVRDIPTKHLGTMAEGIRTFVRNRAKRIFHTDWSIRTIGVKNPDGTWGEAMPYMVEDLVKRFNKLGFGGRKLCAETSGIQFLEPGGYDLARVLLWEGETQYLPLVKFEAEKRDCMLNAAVSREGARLAVSVRKPLKPETLADIARRLEIPFDPDPVESR